MWGVKIMVDVSVVSKAIDLLKKSDWETLFLLISENEELVVYKDEFGETMLSHMCSVPYSAPIIKLLVKLGADLNVVSSDGDTPLGKLIVATYPEDSVFTMEFLLKSGADPNLIGPSGNPPLHWAIYHNKLNHAKVLLDYGADPFIKTTDFYPENAFEIAKQEENEKAIVLLDEWSKERQHIVDKN